MPTTELRADEAAVAEDPALAEEHRRLIELLREGYEDVKAGRVVTSEELDRILDEARARRAARRSERAAAE